jgi:hypothetical protein
VEEEIEEGGSYEEQQEGGFEEEEQQQQGFEEEEQRTTQEDELNEEDEDEEEEEEEEEEDYQQAVNFGDKPKHKAAPQVTQLILLVVKFSLDGPETESWHSCPQEGSSKGPSCHSPSAAGQETGDLCP